MNLAEGFRSRGVTAPLVAEIARSLERPVRIMEVCGTHTMSIFRHGIRSLLPEGITLLSGPGCPVCVTPASQIDAMLAAADREEVTIATFGDLIRVPGNNRSLAGARGRGARVEIVYSPMDALALAQREPARLVLFPAIGFETTAPAIAATVLAAERMGIANFAVIEANKTMPQALAALMDDPLLKVDGLLCPGHVSAIIGSKAYGPLAERHRLACAVAGFEPADILAGLLSLIRQINAGEPGVENCYTRAVAEDGNVRARHLIEQVFEPVTSEWRGLGAIAASGLRLKKQYRRFDGLARLGIAVQPAHEPKGCRCGEILKGRLLPPDCPLYGTACTPMRPVGPCMVSNEGTCAAHFRYGTGGTRRMAAAG
ncbi:MAG: hydrogenase formation protein HypD [Desulfobulbus sp.]|uniref:hydrogenase formation protein HypD n=1 Tax=Desulfobulbus sp. TaxID=895 RepID=UPI00283F82DA|nr:hydrogenase formation protein HypD [Desulfobulbus sp.]MDR2549125.1 hydrogenase formation protein HypD [Desulfobulbus sp.]